MTDSLRGIFSAPIMKRVERQQLQREQTALIKLANGHKWFRRTYDPDDVVRVIDGPVYARHGEAVVKIRGYTNGRIDWGLTCNSCPVGDLVVAEPLHGECGCGCQR